MDLKEQIDITEHITSCPICGTPAAPSDLAEASWLPPAALTLLESHRPGWQLAQGACPRCVQEILLHALAAQGETSHDVKLGMAGTFGLGVEATFGVLPTPMRLHSDPRYCGRGVTLALVDAGFYPHPDLVQPHNRIRAWVDATVEPVHGLIFNPDETPQWPGWDSANPSQWHGLMTSAAAAGNGMQSHGLYRGLACEANLVLVQVRGADGRIGNENITRALRWLREHGPDLGVQVVSISVAGQPTQTLAGNPIDSAVSDLVLAGMTVVAAAGNDGERRLTPPATSLQALTIGGLDDKNNFDAREVDVWHSNYGDSANGISKPELVAPSIWVVAPILPGTEVAAEAETLFATRHLHDKAVEQRIAELKLVTPHYQHVEGTSFAAPLVASTIACMLEANPALTTGQIRDILIRTAQPIEGAEVARQGAGALVPALAIAAALREQGGSLAGWPISPHTDASGGIMFLLHDRDAQDVRVWGSWDPSGKPQLQAKRVTAGIWCAHLPYVEPGSYKYRFLLDGARWMYDPENPRRDSNEMGGFDSIVEAVSSEANGGPPFARIGSVHDTLTHAWS